MIDQPDLLPRERSNTIQLPMYNSLPHILTKRYRKRPSSFSVTSSAFQRINKAKAVENSDSPQSSHHDTSIKQEPVEPIAIPSRKSSLNPAPETQSRKASDDLETIDSDLREKKYRFHSFLTLPQ